MVTRRSVLAAPLALGVGLRSRTQDRATESRRTEGTVLACGGGTLPDAIFERFFELAGGTRGKVVFVPTASERVPELRDVAFGTTKLATRFAKLTLLHTRSRDEADSDAFVAPLREATGVWLGGGDQSRLTAAYLGTRTERELAAVLARGGVVAGTSAGAACMTKIMIAGGTNEAQLAEGFDWIPGTIADQHFLRRSRLDRLLSALARHQDLVGLGIDEGTAVEVRAGNLAVLGASYAMRITGGHFEVLHAGQKAALRG